MIMALSDDGGDGDDYDIDVFDDDDEYDDDGDKDVYDDDDSDGDDEDKDAYDHADDDCTTMKVRKRSQSAGPGKFDKKMGKEDSFDQVKRDLALTKKKISKRLKKVFLPFQKTRWSLKFYLTILSKTTLKKKL